MGLDSPIYTHDIQHTTYKVGECGRRRWIIRAIENLLSSCREMDERPGKQVATESSTGIPWATEDGEDYDDLRWTRPALVVPGSRLESDLKFTARQLYLPSTFLATRWVYRILLHRTRYLLP